MSSDDGITRDGDAALREQLTAQRAEAEQRARDAERDFARIVEAAQSVSTDDEHDPDGAGLAVERAQIVALLEQARIHIADADAALERLDAGHYGRCGRCGRPIGAERLQVRPEASQCIACARAETGRR